MHVQTVSLILPAVFGFLIDFAMSQQRPNEKEKEVNIQGISFVEHKKLFFQNLWELGGSHDLHCIVQVGVYSFV